MIKKISHTPTTQNKPFYHFIGIGGIGMSSIAAILRLQGYQVSGCDSDINQKSVALLSSLGCLVHAGNNSPGCADPSITTIVRTSAVKEDHPEVVAARKRGIPVLHRAEVLAELTRQHKTIAVSGSHGKTTTTSLIGHILSSAATDPLIIVGGHMQNLGANFRFGQGEYLVAEADESDRSFLLLHPTIAVITNIDLEHLDTYRDAADLKATFKQFIDKLPASGHAFVCIDDPLSHELLMALPASLKQKVITFGCAATADYQLMAYQLDEDSSTGQLKLPDGTLITCTLPLPGKHNLLNALVALAVCKTCAVPLDNIIEGLASFKGVEQRFTFRGMFQGAYVFDDYAHHPTEIAMAIAVAKKKKKGALRIVFQPHRFSRTQKLWNDFVTILSDKAIDELLVAPIYPASETPIEGITSDRLVADISARRQDTAARTIALETEYDSFIAALKKSTQQNDLLLFLGAGKVNRLAQLIAKKS